MKPLAILVLLACLLCLQSLVIQQQGSNSRVLYTITDSRYIMLSSEFEQLGSTDQKLTRLNLYVNSYGFTCNNVWYLLNKFIDDDTRIQGLQILKDNIVDPQNKESKIINNFSTPSSQAQAADILKDITACQTAGPAPDVFPYPVLNFTSVWADSDFDNLIAKINSASSDKLSIAQAVILSSTNGFNAQQTLAVFDTLSDSDKISLAEAIKDRIMGLSCDDVQTILGKIYFSNDKISALTILKDSVIDWENKYSILKVWTSPTEKAKATQILINLKPKSFLFDTPNGNCYFLLDYSASMDATFTLSTGEKISRLEFMQREFEKAALNFDANVTFNVIIFNNVPLYWRSSLAPSTRANVLDAIAFTKKIASGNTNIYDSLSAAWSLPNVGTIYLLTDGLPNVGQVTDADAIVKDVKDWYQRKPNNIKTIALLTGNDSADNKPATKTFAKNLADVTNGVYRALESDQ